MTKYMIRRPEFLRGAEQARFFPGTVITMLIGLAIFAAWILAGAIMTLIYATTAAGRIMTGQSDMDSVVQTVLVIALLSEGLLILFTIIHVRFIEKRPLRTAGFIRKGFAKKYIAGFGIGFLLLGLNMLPVFLTMPVEFTGIKPVALLFLVIFMIQAAGEEVLFRGYYMSALLRRGGAVKALLLSNIIFMLFHVFNGYSLTQLLGVTILGALLSLYMLRYNNLWGAMGLHAAWNFFTVCMVPISLGPYEIGYAFFRVDMPADEDIMLTIIQLLIFLVTIALLLFAGKNRLVVRKTQEQIQLEKALNITRNALSGDKALLQYAMRVSELAQSSGGKTAALLCHAESNVSSGYLRREFGDNMQNAIDAMHIMHGDSPKKFWERVMKHPAALDVKKAETRLEEIRRKRYTGGPYAWFTGGSTQCPMLRWGIEADFCRHITKVVEGMPYDAGEEYMAQLDHNVCRRCPGRQYMGSLHTQY